MKNIFSKFGTYILDFIAAILIGMLVETFAPLPILLAADLSTLSTRVIKAAFFIIVTTAWLFFSARTIGYKSKETNIRGLLVSIILIFALQQVLSPLFNYAEYISGGVLALTYAIFLGNDPFISAADSHLASDVPIWGYHVVMLAVALVFYLPAIITGEYLGVKKREKDRNELINGSKAEK